MARVQIEDLVDKEYLNRCGLSSSNITMTEAMQKMMWGTYGYPAKLPLEWKRLIDLSTNHLRNILRTQPQVSDSFRKVITNILRKRGAPLPGEE